MQNKRVTKSLLLLVASLLMLSCDRKTEVFCGCGGTLEKNVQDDEAIVVNTWDGYLIISLNNGYQVPCGDLPSELLNDGQMLLITGKIRVPCKKMTGALNSLQDYPFELTNFQVPKDSLFKSDPISISIFQSIQPERAGYGYYIKSTGIKIRQEFIPGIGGRKPFVSQTEAFKLAVLVAYKVKLQQGLPYVTETDLYRLQITIK